MMTASNQDIQEKLRQLRESYARALPSKIAEIEASWQDLLADPADAAQLQTLIRLCHTLAGSGTSFGFPEVTRLCRDIEQRLLAVQEQSLHLDQELQDSIQSHLGALAQEATHTPDTISEQDYPAQPAHPSAEQQRQIMLFSATPEDFAELRKLLAGYGYNVTETSEPRELLADLVQHPPLVLLLDISMSSQPHVELLSELKQQQLDIPVIVISDSVNTAGRLLAVRAGVKAYFTKPLNTPGLIDTLDHLTNAEPHDPYRVLIIDDSETSAEFYAYTLQQAGMEARVIHNPMQVMDVINEFSPELILMDLYMPECTGNELAELIRQQESYIGTPIVFLSAETNIDKQLLAMQHGGDDFLTKPIRAIHLVTSVTSRVERFRKLRAMMVRDSLTGLYNHTAITEILEREIERSHRQNNKLSYVMLDIDNFKQVNDSYGHAAGDIVLKSLARLLKQRLRKTDYIGRYGGEEFAIVMPDTDSATAYKVIDELRATFADLQHNVQGQLIQTTFSAGVACFPDYWSAAELGKQADMSLYQAKQAGRDRIIKACKDNN